MGTHRLGKLRIDILIHKSKRQAVAKTPSPIKHVDTPKDTGCKTTTVRVLEVIKKTSLSVKSHLYGFTRSNTNEAPRDQLLIAMEVIDAL